MSQPIRIVLIDDHIRVHQGISAALDAFDDMELVGHGSNGQECMQLCAQHLPDIVLMDIMMPNMNGIEATRQIHKKYPQIKILALSSFQDAEAVHAILQAGAMGYILKSTAIDDLAQTLRAAATGKSVFSSEITQLLLQLTPESPAATPEYGLTPREKEVLKLMVSGLNNNEIAAALGVSFSTAKFHVSSVMAKLRVTNRVEAVALAAEKRLVS